MITAVEGKFWELLEPLLEAHPVMGAGPRMEFLKKWMATEHLSEWYIEFNKIKEKGGGRLVVFRINRINENPEVGKK